MLWFRRRQVRPAAGQHAHDHRAAPPDEIAGTLLAATTKATRAAALAILAAQSPRRLLMIDEALRDQWSYVTGLSQPISRQSLTDPIDELSLVLAATHRDGHHRERAVAALAGHGGVLAPRMLMIRSTDWVPQVRRQARVALSAMLRSSTEAGLLTHTAEFAAAVSARRQGGWLVDTARDAFRRASPATLTNLLTTTDQHTRRLAHRIGVDNATIGPQRLIDIVHTDPDVTIRLMCARHLLTTAHDARHLMTSKIALIRAEALQALITTEGPETAKNSLTDRHRLVRAIAQQAVRTAGINPTTRYRELVDQGHLTAATLAGLGETGTSVDAPVLTAALTDPRSRVRTEAVRALRGVGAVDPTTLAPLLWDESPSVTRQVVTAMLPHTAAMTRADLEAMLAEDNPRHTRLAALRLIRAKNVWLRVITDLRLVHTGDDLAATARTDVENWLRYEAATTYRTPDRELIRELRDLLHVLPRHRARVAFIAGIDQHR